ncbi:MAG: hypothetical protein AW11_03903 [Candidatus Accumulibacter regalis]|jgi:hypothetical protein|uniref:DUF1289 domain-containing protein n=1 Tax=Accumulibacter regalis TaxID=522306 RepID=A0A011Q563_ACCRE|nr:MULTISPECIES: DUF1289 domain-containing protein [unclassified Candidatus Accumulibacter]EXI84427.1 MAG: hypothetical protein AW11_03903 [Candidatus Accumulibacter regalis]MQM33669.1 DUF1289 domain-containing protein [Candidatus Accumulibacter phosphatis]MBL8367414.1 DUF1289 domain-containing protein [Accumulibacter sp.]MBN8514140.1 DUF1289 domain-containing protein [Accumulibacter sp.]MBO3703085.1 DUF1289 domain-containing protein [Accumulibacter sp.]
MSETEDDYLCVGVCMFDPDSGYCLGCGRPPEPVSDAAQGIVVEEVQPLRVVDEGLNGDSPDKS